MLSSSTTKPMNVMCMLLNLRRVTSLGVGLYTLEKANIFLLPEARHPRVLHLGPDRDVLQVMQDSFPSSTVSKERSLACSVSMSSNKCFTTNLSLVGALEYSSVII